MKYLIAIAVTLLVLAGFTVGGYKAGSNFTDAKYRAIISKADKAHADEVIALQQRVATAEHKTAAAVADIDTHYQEVISNEKANTDRTIAELRDGAIGLRKRLAAVAVSSTGLPCSGPGAGKCDGVQAIGLQKQDAEFLVRLASDADQVANQLRACQAVVKADRAQ